MHLDHGRASSATQRSRSIIGHIIGVIHIHLPNIIPWVIRASRILRVIVIIQVLFIQSRVTLRVSVVIVSAVFVALIINLVLFRDLRVRLNVIFIAIFIIWVIVLLSTAVGSLKAGCSAGGAILGVRVGPRHVILLLMNVLVAHVRAGVLLLHDRRALSVVLLRGLVLGLLLRGIENVEVCVLVILLDLGVGDSMA